MAGFNPAISIGLTFREEERNLGQLRPVQLISLLRSRPIGARCVTRRLPLIEMSYSAAIRRI